MLRGVQQKGSSSSTDYPNVLNNIDHSYRDQQQHLHLPRHLHLKIFRREGHYQQQVPGEGLPFARGYQPIEINESLSLLDGVVERSSLVRLHSETWGGYTCDPTSSTIHQAGYQYRILYQLSKHSGRADPYPLFIPCSPTGFLREHGAHEW